MPRKANQKKSSLLAFIVEIVKKYSFKLKRKDNRKQLKFTWKKLQIL